MTDSHFSQLLRAAASQPQPQRLLFVFAGAELSEDADADQRARFERGEGGALVPVMCVDKAPEDLASFDALVAESRQLGRTWHVVFAAGLGGANGLPPSSAQIDTALESMVESVRQGAIGRFAAYDSAGRALTFD